MKFTVIENTNVRVSRLSFGTASLHHLFSDVRRQRLLAAAADVGITHFDTSPYYGYGLAESDLGQFMRGRRSDFTITTKFGLYARGKEACSGWDVWARKALGKIHKPHSRPVVDWSVLRARASLEASLKRLNCDYVDFLFLHEPDPGMANADELLRWLEDEQTRGRVRYWGLAGLPSRLEPWLNVEHPLTSVLQVKDGIVERTANFAPNRKRKFQFTYGYLSSGPKGSSAETISDILNGVIKRNATGSVLMSTRRSERLKQLAVAFQ